MKFLDTTLRDGEQTPGVSLTADKKLWIARALDKLGVDVIEAGAAVTSEGERAAMRDMLEKIQTGEFAREWILENQAHRPVFNALVQQEREHPVEVVGAQLRAMMSWLK